MTPLLHESVRVTETSVTEYGRYEPFHAVKMRTRGYGIGYVSEYGVGAHVTALTSYGDGNAFSITHRYVDVSYTVGDTWLLTLGGGKGTHDASAAFIGPGFSVGDFEVYWIHRRNWLPGLASHHWQLGLAWRL